MGVSDKTKLRKEKLKNKATTDLLNVLGFRLDDHCNVIDKDGNPVAVGADNRPLILQQMAKNLGIDPSASPVIAQNENGKRPASAAKLAPAIAQAPTLSQAELEMEKQLIHVSKKKKKGTNNENTENMIHSTIKNTSWRKVKFVHGEASRKKVALMVLEDMDMEKFKGDSERAVANREKWVEAFGGVVTKKYNKHRSYAQTQTSQACKKWMATHNGQLPDIDRLTAIIKRDLDPQIPADMELMKWWWTDVLPMACGNRDDWNDEKKYYVTISEGAPPNYPRQKYITPSTEAIAVLFIENLRSKWTEINALKQLPEYAGCTSFTAKVHLEYEKDAQGKPTDVLAYEHRINPNNPKDVTLNHEKFWGKYTILTAGQCADSGWTHAGRKLFKDLTEANKAARLLPKCKDLEEAVLKSLRAEQGIQADTHMAEKLRKRRELNKKTQESDEEGSDVEVEFDE